MNENFLKPHRTGGLAIRVKNRTKQSTDNETIGADLLRAAIFDYFIPACGTRSEHASTAQ